jgi:hypothetical protein
MVSSGKMTLFPDKADVPGDFSSPEKWLDAYSVESLQTLCRSRGISFRNNISKRALGRLLAAELFRSTFIRHHLDELDDPEYRWLALFRECGGVLSSSQVTERVAGGMSNAALGKLTTRGLVLPGPFDGFIPSGEFDVTEPTGPLWCPEPIRFLSDNQSTAGLIRAYDGKIADEKIADRRTLEYDLMVMADLFGSAPVRRLKSGFPGKRFLIRAATTLNLESEILDTKQMESSGYLLLLYELLSKLGLLRIRNDYITTSDRMEGFFRSSSAERSRALAEAWRETTWHNEFYLAPELNFERDFPDYEHGDGKTDDMPTPERLIMAREYLCTLAGELPVGRWVTLQSVMYAGYVRDDTFLIRPPQSYFYAHAPLYQGIWATDRSAARGQWSNGLERAGNWPLVEGAFIRKVFTNSLHRLGLVDTAQSETGETLVRLNETGAWLLGGADQPHLELPSGKALVVQPNFEIIVFPEGQDVGLLWPLMQASETVSRDVTLTLRITSDSIHRASQRDISAEYLLGLLREHARVPVPNNISQAMSDWDQRYQQVTLTTQANLVEASSAAEFDRFLAEVNRDQTVVRRLSETIGLVVGPASRLPSMTSLDYGKLLPASIQVEDNLEVAIDPVRENWMLQPALSSIAEQTGNYTYRVTQESVDDAIAHGMNYEDALRSLRDSSTSELPTRAMFKLKGLFGQLGMSAVSEATIISVEQESVLAQMLEIEDFRKLLLRRLGSNTALVRSDKLDELNDLLAEFGISDNPAILETDALPPTRLRQPDGDRVEPEPSGRRRLQTYSSRKSREIFEEAIRQNRRVRLFYRPQAGGRTQERTVDPISVERRHGVAYLTAFCHLRGETQVFRIPSIDRVELLDSPASSK